MDVPVARVVHEGAAALPSRAPWAICPHESNGASLLLSDVVLQAAAVPADAAAEHEASMVRPVNQVGVVPVVETGAADDHGAAFGNLRVGGKLPSLPV